MTSVTRETYITDGYSLQCAWIVYLYIIFMDVGMSNDDYLLMTLIVLSASSLSVHVLRR